MTEDSLEIKLKYSPDMNTKELWRCVTN